MADAVFGAMAPMGTMPVPTSPQGSAALPPDIRNRIAAMIATRTLGNDAAQNSYDPFAAENFVPSGVADWATEAAPKDFGILNGMTRQIATLPQRALDTAAHDFGNRGDHSVEPQLTGPALEAAMLPMGTGTIAAVPLRAGETALGAGLIRGSTPEAKADWIALRREIEERRAAAKRLQDALQTDAPEHVDPFAGMNDAETAAAFERALRATQKN